MRKTIRLKKNKMKKNKDVVLFEANGKVEEASPTVRQCGIKSLGLKALEAYLISKGYSVEIIMQNHQSKKNMVAKILSLNPRVVGATATTCEIPITAEIMKAIKKFNREIITLIGGYHVSACPETIDPNFAKSHGVDPSGIDLLILGEGEITLSEIVKKVVKEKYLNCLHNIAGIAFYSQGKIIKTHPRKRIKNLDLLPKTEWTKNELDANEFGGIMYRPEKGQVTAIISERGCPFGCIFCSTKSTYGNIVSTRSINSLVDEIQFLVKERKVNMLVDYAPTANRDHGRIHKFCQEIRKRGLQKKFSLYALWRLQSPGGKFMVNEEIISDLAMTLKGLKIGFGIEALSEKDEALLEKNSSTKYIALISKWFDKHGALLRGFYMITPETDETSIVNCKTTKLISHFDDLRVTHLTPFPKTRMSNILKNRLLTKDWNDYNCEQPVIQSIHLNESKLSRAQKAILQNFLKNPHRQKRILRKISAHPHLANCFREYNKKMESFHFITMHI